MLDHIPYKGFWSLTCDCESEDPTCSTEINTMLEILRKLQEKMPKLFPKPPKAIKYYKELDSLLVYTSDNSEEVIKKSAEAIRSNVDFPFIMYFLKRNISDSKDTKLQYKHTPDGELYRFSYNDKSAVSPWKLISPTSTFDELLPSQVTDRDYIHLPANEEDFKKATTEKGGKWLLHCADLETLDNLWKNLIRLYVRGVIVGLKSSTAIFSITKISPGYHTKAIMCYTANSDCQSCVKRAAESIFICTGYNFEMYYKSNAASRAGLYHHEGFKGISRYMFTSGGKMYEKDHLNRWKKVVFDEEKHK